MGRKVIPLLRLLEGGDPAVAVTHGSGTAGVQFAPVEVRTASDVAVEVVPAADEAAGVEVALVGGDGRVCPDHIEAAAKANASRLQAQHAWLGGLEAELKALVLKNASRRSKYRSLRQLALRIESAISEVSACRRGCSACCHIAVVVTGTEAAILGEAIGVKPGAARSQSSEEIVNAGFKVPCSFLEGRECGIYENRPLACILHHNLGPDASMCETSVNPEDSYVPRVNLNGFWMMCTLILQDLECGDIREYFPNGKTAG